MIHQPGCQVLVDIRESTGFIWMKINVITCSAVCSFAPHSQATLETTTYLCVSKRNRAMPVRRRLSLTHAGLVKPNPGGIGLTSLINVWSVEAFSRYSMHHLYSAHRATLLHDWAGLFSSSSAACTNGYLDLSCLSCPPSKDRSLSYERSSGSRVRPAKDSTAFWRRSSVGWMPGEIKFYPLVWDAGIWSLCAKHC